MFGSDLTHNKRVHMDMSKDHLKVRIGMRMELIIASTYMVSGEKTLQL